MLALILTHKEKVVFGGTRDLARIGLYVLDRINPNANDPWFRGHGGNNIGMNPKSGTLLVTNSFAGGSGYLDDLLSLWSSFNAWAAKH